MEEEVENLKGWKESQGTSDRAHSASIIRTETMEKGRGKGILALEERERGKERENLVRRARMRMKLGAWIRMARPRGGASRIAGTERGREKEEGKETKRQGPMATPTVTVLPPPPLTSHLFIRKQSPALPHN